MTLRAYDTFGYGRLGGLYHASCSRCTEICSYWDEDDLDEDGNLLHDCQA